MNMQPRSFVFRADASIEMGSGHIMRCLTLANELRRGGHQTAFICRNQPGSLEALVQQSGHRVYVLPRVSGDCPTELDEDGPAHARWLGCHWRLDAEHCTAILHQLRPDWLIVDHYAIDARWEAAVAGHLNQIAVIDDLADRPHQCSLLLDQNLGRTLEHYSPWIGSSTRCLTGPAYALLRPEFAELRAAQKYRLQRCRVKRLLISMGGTDPKNITAQALTALQRMTLPPAFEIRVILGRASPFREHIQQLVGQMPVPTILRQDISDMGQEMMSADLALGAAGSTSWERCCLGLPAVLVAFAPDQQFILDQLTSAGAALVVQRDVEGQWAFADAIQSLIDEPGAVQEMSRRAAQLCDGKGVERVTEQLMAATA